MKIIDKFSYILARIRLKLKAKAIYDSQIDKSSKIQAGSQIVTTIMERYSYCGYDCTFLNCHIGSFCSIADNVYVGGAKHPIHFVSTSPVFLSHRQSIRTKFSKHVYQELPRTIIGHDVWIGRGAKIRAGVNIGHGAVIGMGAIVTKDVAPYAIVGGNPAKLIRKRFDDDVIEKLLASKWWDANDEDLRRMAANFNDPELFLQDWV